MKITNIWNHHLGVWCVCGRNQDQLMDFRFHGNPKLFPPSATCCQRHLAGNKHSCAGWYHVSMKHQRQLPCMYLHPKNNGKSRLPRGPFIEGTKILDCHWDGSTSNSYQQSTTVSVPVSNSNLPASWSQKWMHAPCLPLQIFTKNSFSDAAPLFNPTAQSKKSMVPQAKLRVLLPIKLRIYIIYKNMHPKLQNIVAFTSHRSFWFISLSDLSVSPVFCKLTCVSCHGFYWQTY